VVVGQLDARAARRAAARLQALQRFQDGLGLIAARSGQRGARGARVDHDGQPVALVQLLGQGLQGSLDQRELVLGGHRARDIDQEHQIHRGAAGLVQLARLDGHPGQLVGRIPRAGRGVQMDREGASVGGRGIGVGEVIHQLLDAHRVLGRQLSIGQVAPHHRVGRAIHVDREGGQRMVGHALERILADDVVVILAGTDDAGFGGGIGDLVAQARIADGLPFHHLSATKRIRPAGSIRQSFVHRLCRRWNGQRCGRGSGDHFANAVHGLQLFFKLLELQGRFFHQSHLDGCILLHIHLRLLLRQLGRTGFEQGVADDEYQRGSRAERDRPVQREAEDGRGFRRGLQGHFLVRPQFQCGLGGQRRFQSSGQGADFLHVLLRGGVRGADLVQARAFGGVEFAQRVGGPAGIIGLKFMMRLPGETAI
jgi:hypothetical protein